MTKLTETILDKILDDLTATDIQLITKATAKDIKALTGLTDYITNTIITIDEGLILLPAAALKGLTTEQTKDLNTLTLTSLLNLDALDFGALTSVQLNALTKANLENAANSLSELTSTQGDTTNAFLAKLSTTITQKISPEFIGALTADLDIKASKFSGKQLAAIKNEDLFTITEIKPQDFKYLSTTLVSSITDENKAPAGFVQYITNQQVSALTASTLLTVTHLEALQPSKAAHLSAAYLDSIKDASAIGVIGNLNIIKNLPVKDLTATALGNLSPTQISVLTPKQIKELNKEFKGPSETDAALKLSKTFLDALTATQKQAIPTEIIENFVKADFIGKGGTGDCAVTAATNAVEAGWANDLSATQLETLTGLTTTTVGCAFGVID
jgi:hypothetical protein